jgi:hypothetical protein
MYSSVCQLMVNDRNLRSSDVIDSICSGFVAGFKDVVPLNKQHTTTAYRSCGNKVMCTPTLLKRHTLVVLTSMKDFSSH